MTAVRNPSHHKSQSGQLFSIEQQVGGGEKDGGLGQINMSAENNFLAPALANVVPPSDGSL